MTVSRSSIAQHEMTQATSSRGKTLVSSAKKRVAKSAGTKPQASRSASAMDKQEAAAMLAEIKLDGEALSARIERLRHRFP